MAKQFGEGSFKSPKKMDVCNIDLVTSREGNVYSGDIIAWAKWTTSGFLLRKDSLVRKSNTAKGNPGVPLTKEKIKNAGLFVDRDSEYYKLKEDILLPSPTYAARLVHGFDISGHVGWTDKEGLQLKHLLR